MEIIMHYDLVPAYHTWNSVAIPFRIIVYALFFGIQPYVSRYYFKLHFGQYIDHLKEVLDQAA